MSEVLEGRVIEMLGSEECQLEMTETAGTV